MRERGQRAGERTSLVAGTQRSAQLQHAAAELEIETLATYLPASGGWESIGASAETLDELRNLEARCRHRESSSSQQS